MNKLILLLALAVNITNAFAIDSHVLLKTDKSWNGGSFEYPGGEPELTMLKVTIGADEETPFHCHPVPTFAYVLDGTIEVETKAGKKHTFQQGDAIMEVMDTIHRGQPVNGAVELLVFYAGSKTQENTFPADHSECIATKR